MSKIETNVIKPEVKFMENENEYSILTIEQESNLDGRIDDVNKYIQIDGKDKLDDEKNELYKNAQNLWREYASCLKSAKYNFYLNRVQYKFLTDLILRKIEYDVNTVFFAIELTDMLVSMKDVKYSNDSEIISFPVNATEITYIYHLIATYKVKGLVQEAYTFSQILKRIGSISKVFNYYDTAGKSLSTDIQNWVASFDENVHIEERHTDLVSAEVIEPKKTSKKSTK